MLKGIFLYFFILRILLWFSVCKEDIEIELLVYRNFINNKVNVFIEC